MLYGVKQKQETTHSIRLPAHARHDLTDAEWAIIEPLLPVKTTNRGRPAIYSKRQLLNGIFFRTRTGCPWRDIPEYYGPFHRIYDLYATFAKNGTWHTILFQLLSTDTLGYDPLETISIDSTIIRGHLHAAGARTDSQLRHPTEPDDHGFGRSTGGWGTKIHAATTIWCDIVAVILTAGQAHDAPQAPRLLHCITVPGKSTKPRTKPRIVIADKAYSSNTIRHMLRSRKITACIPERSTSITARKNKGRKGGRPYKCPPDLYQQRNTIERGFAKLKQHRAVSTRYDKLATMYETTIVIANIKTLLKQIS